MSSRNRWRTLVAVLMAALAVCAAGTWWARPVAPADVKEAEAVHASLASGGAGGPSAYLRRVHEGTFGVALAPPDAEAGAGVSSGSPSAPAATGTVAPPSLPGQDQEQPASALFDAGEGVSPFSSAGHVAPAVHGGGAWLRSTAPARGAGSMPVTPGSLAGGAAPTDAQSGATSAAGRGPDAQGYGGLPGWLPGLGGTGSGSRAASMFSGPQAPPTAVPEPACLQLGALLLFGGCGHALARRRAVWRR